MYVWYSSSRMFPGPSSTDKPGDPVLAVQLSGQLGRSGQVEETEEAQDPSPVRESHRDCP